jgi:hypothetical protein
MRWAGNVARMEDRRGAYRVLMGKPEGKSPLERPRRRRADSIKTDLQEMGWELGLDLSGSRQGQVAGSCNVVTNLWILQNMGNFLISWGHVIFSRRTLHNEVSKLHNQSTTLTLHFKLQALANTGQYSSPFKHHESTWSGHIAQLVQYLGTWWRSMVSFRPRLLYLRANRSLGGPQKRSGR